MVAFHAYRPVGPRGTGFQQHRPDKRGARGEHADPPAAPFADAIGQARPERQTQCAADEVQRQEQPGQSRQLQAIGNEEKRQRGGNCHGDRIDEIHARQPSKGRVAQWLSPVASIGAYGSLRSRRGEQQRSGADVQQYGEGHRERSEPGRHAVSIRYRARQHAGQHHAEKPGAFAPGGDPGPSVGVIG